MCDCAYVCGTLARYVAPDGGEKELSRDMGEGLQALIDGALVVSDLKRFLGREQPTVITVSIFPFLICET